MIRHDCCHEDRVLVEEVSDIPKQPDVKEPSRKEELQRARRHDIRSPTKLQRPARAHDGGVKRVRFLT
jgi:formiminotetrahydrofolate cyclodeaminase